ncbi:agamous-like MADS-box protein AGL80, partial [Zingiber officinale]
MARKKVTLGWIAHDATRRTTFKKRKQSLLKKVSELATLCAIDACAVVYGPEDEAPEAWPSPAETARVAARFRAVPESDQNRKKTDQEGFLRQRAAKLREQLSRQDRGNRELEASLLMHEMLSGGGWRMCDVGIEQAAELVRLAEIKLALVRNRVEREKARTAVEPPRQAVEQVVAMAVGPSIEFVKTPWQAAEQVVDMAEDPWIGFVLPPLQAVEQAVGTVETVAEDETLNWL